MTKSEKISKIIKREKPYTVQNRALCFLPGDRIPAKSAGEGLLGKFQGWLKQWGRIYYALLYVFAPVLPSVAQIKAMRQCLAANGTDQVILNLGSGPNRVSSREDIINVDIFAFDQVDVVADATDLHFENDVADLILNTAMLEHTPNPQKVVQEMHRVLRPNGVCYCFLPFIAPFHAAPHDYYRWTLSGIETLFAEFESVDIGIGAGPMSGFLYVLIEWLSILLSFGSKQIHDILFLLLLVLLAPFKLLDLILVYFPYAERVAGGFFVVGKKTIHVD
jgi:SAM-dependent methyltransferase